MTNIKAQTFTTLDDFSDGNFNANPVWTPSSGTWQVSSGVLQVAGSSGTYRIATPFTKVCNAWEFRFDLDGSGFTGQKVEYYFFMTSASSNPSTANGYRVSYNITSNTATNTILLENLTNGVANTIVTFSNMSGDQNIRVTRENNLWKLFTAGILRGSGTDATYAPQNSAFQGALITIPSGGAVNYNHGIDNIRFAEFIPPTLNAQYNGEESKSICNGAGYTLTANPVGGSNCWMASANWEYAWYTGTGTDATYWNGSTWTNAENYSSTYVSIPNVAPSATTTYKVKVRCSADAASGVGLDPTGVTVTVAPQPVAPELTKNPNTASVCQNTSITITTGGGSGGVEGTNTDEYRYSTDNGVNWTALSSTIPVFNAVTGTNIIQSRRVSTGAGCNTSSSNQVSWTVNALTSNTTTVNATNSYVWAVNGQTYTSSGNYQSVNGCNTEILNLTINTTSVNAGIFESFAIINFGGANVFYDLNANTGNTDFNSVSLGNYNSGNTLILKGAQNKIFKCTGFDITNGKLLYRIYKSGNTPGTFNEVNLPFASNDAGAGDGCQNQTWQEANANINLLSGLCDGDYTIEVFTQADYTGNGGGIIYANNGGNYYKASFSINNSQQSGIYESYINFKSGNTTSFYNLNGSPVSTLPNFNGLNLGSFCPNASLIISGGENKTYKCPANDVVNGKLFYRIYPGTTASGSFTEINLPFKENIDGAQCNNGQNQIWQSLTNTTNILTGLTPGTYTIEVYSQADYNSNGICPGSHFSSNGGANYKASFTVLTLNTYYQDNDGDGYGTDNTTSACSKPAGYATQGGDCNDNNAAINPGATEICNNIDDNCDGQIDEGVKPAEPAKVNCWDNYVFDNATCQWVNNGTQPEQPATACYEIATFNTTTCQWEVTGTQPEQPATACYEIATFNTTTCQWDVTGTQPEQPRLACYESATFNTTSCSWDVSGTQPEQPSLACYESATFNTTSCSWDVTGTQPAQPTLACYESATFNTTSCSWDVSGTQPVQPSLACYESANFNTTTCSWDLTGTQPEQPSLACYESANFNTTTCSWDVTGTQPAQPTLACYESATFNTTSCSWDVSGTQPEQPSLACYESANFNTTTCSWDVTGTQPEQPSLACYESATFNTTSCSWDVTGTQPEQPSLACYESANFNTTTCSWDVTGTQPEQPTLACYESATFNTTSCSWDVSGTQPEQPTLACYESATFNTTSCSWDVSGTQPEQPTLACYESATFNTTSCSWDVTGTQPEQPTLACYESATFNTTSCSWDVTGTQPEQASLACYESANFNTTTCSWDVTGTQPEQPSLACYESANFNTTTCSWDVTGTQPAQPTLACYESATFNTTSCSWDVSGTQPEQPSLACYESATFNTTSCSWDVTGTQPAQPTLACYESATFNTTSCSWDVTGTQPAQPTLACYESATFNTNSCSWDVSGTQPEQPATACYETATFNTTSCEWVVSGTQPTKPATACYETATFNTTSCEWVVSGTQPEQPSLACYESATFNTTSCSWDVTGTQPEQPSLACYETATFNTTSCDWDVTGTQPTKPATACYETATFNTTSCDWDVTGTQPTKPATACYETATFNTQTCKWDVTGTQPTQPSIACYETATFNGTSCQWVVTGTQPTRPNTACYETATFNTQTCKWDVTGTQPQQPTLACYESANFNTTTCSWVVTGTKPQEPAKVNCWDNYVFNTNQCKWINTGTPNLVSIIISSDEGKFSASSNTIDFNAPVPSSYSITFKASPIANGGSNPTYTWKRNGITVGTNSNTYTGTGWSNGETIQCILTSNATCVSGNPALSNTVSIRVTLPNYFVVSDKEADRIFYYDADFNLVRSNPISSKKEVNAEDIWAISSDVYVLSGSEQRVYRINGSATTSSVSRKLRNTDGKNLKSLSGLAIIGNHLLVVEDKSEFIYRYNLDDAYNGTSNYNALQRIALNKDNKDAEALGYDAANNIIYVLDNDREKTIFRYPVTSLTASRISVGNATRSRKMKSQNGAGIKKALGLAVDQTFIRITDQGPDRAYTYRIADLFAGNNSGNLNALSVNSLNGQNKYSTGISLFYSPVPLVSNISTPFVKKANDQYSIPNTTSAIDLRVLGNPSSTYFRLQPVSSDKKQRMVIRVMDVNGRIMEQFDQLKEGQTLQIGGAYRQGLYFAELIQGKQRKVVRLIKGN